MKISNLVERLRRPFLGEHDAQEDGMTIIEILIVIALIGTLMSIIMTNLLDKSDDAKVDLTRISQKKLSESLRLYKLNHHNFPTTEDGLQALLEAPASAKNWRGPYVEPEKVRDAWDQVFHYQLLGGKSYVITSMGPDGELGSADDIIFPDAKNSQEEGPETIELMIPKGQKDVE